MLFRMKSLRDKQEESLKPKEKVVAEKPKKSKRKSKRKSMKTLKTILGLVLVFGLVYGGVTLAADYINNFYGPATITQTDDGMDADTEGTFGAFPGPEIYQDITVHGWMTSLNKTVAVGTGLDIWATTTLVVADSGTTYLLSASGTTITLPIASTTGVTFRFQINGAATSSNFMINSKYGDNIEGSMTVAGVVSDCDAADTITFDTGFENIGDFVEIMSDGTYWLIGESSTLTAGALACSG